MQTQGALAGTQSPEPQKYAVPSCTSTQRVFTNHRLAVQVRVAFVGCKFLQLLNMFQALNHGGWYKTRFWPLCWQAINRLNQSVQTCWKVKNGDETLNILDCGWSSLAPRGLCLHTKEERKVTRSKWETIVNYCVIVLISELITGPEGAYLCVCACILWRIAGM